MYSISSHIYINIFFFIGRPLSKNHGTLQMIVFSHFYLIFVGSIRHVLDEMCIILIVIVRNAKTGSNEEADHKLFILNVFTIYNDTD
jgi:hypothetical protein